MSMEIRPTLPSFRTPKAKKVTYTANAGYIIIGQSLDGKRFYAKNATAGNLYESSQQAGTNPDAVTWTLTKAFGNFGANYTINKITETLGGEVLVFFSSITLVPFVQRSDGWTADRTTATWTTVLTGVAFGATTRLNAYTSSSGCQGISPVTGKNIMVACEYGGQTDSSHNPTGNVFAARRGWYSSDDGKVGTWTQIIDIYLMPTGIPYPSGTHTHGMWYDADWDMIGVVYGDLVGNATTIAGANAYEMAFCTNYSSGSPTWTYLNYDATTARLMPQFTVAHSTKSALVLLGDQAWDCPLVILPKVGYRKFGQSVLPVFGESNCYLGNHLERRVDDGNGPYPIFAGVSNSVAPSACESFVITDDGLTVSNFVREQDLTTYVPVLAQNIGGFFGPDINGKIMANYAITTGGGPFLVTANLVDERADFTKAYLSSAGVLTVDGATTSPGVVALTTATPANVCFIDLEEGSYEITADAFFSLTGATLSGVKAGLSLVSATLPSADVNGLSSGGVIDAGAFVSQPIITTTLTDTLSITIPPTPAEAVVPTGTTLGRTIRVYLVAQATFSAGTVRAYGGISAKKLII